MRFTSSSKPLFAAEAYLLYAALAWRSLKDETLPVAAALFRGDLDAARSALSRVVGRDTDVLDEVGMVRAAVETVVENSVDGVLSVLFFAALGYVAGGCVAAVLSVWTFKAVSTLDSMVGYESFAVPSDVEGMFMILGRQSYSDRKNVV